MARRPMTCRELISLLSQYHDSTLAPWQRVRANEHLSRCEKCTGYLHGYERTIVLIKDSVEDRRASANPKLREDFVERILAAVRKS
jgi:predicted anti-sigma-YlaC factor YlaD